MTQADSDKWLAGAQIAFAGFLLFSINALVFILVLFKTQLSETGTTILTSVIAALITILTLAMNFFFARTRPAALPDPNNSTTTTTTTTAPITSGTTNAQTTISTSPTPQP